MFKISDGYFSRLRDEFYLIMGNYVIHRNDYGYYETCPDRQILLLSPDESLSAKNSTVPES